MSIPAVDFQVHNSLFLIAHFHSVIIGGVLFGFFAGAAYWFPKFIGFKLNEKLGKYAFWFWFIGFLAAFLPLYILGLMGATRRLDHYESGTGWQPLFMIAAVGVVLITVGIGIQVLQLIVSIRDRKKNMDTTGDPWNGRTLEWSTTSPPPVYNFAIIPEVHDHDPFWEMKQGKAPQEKVPYQPIHMPKDTHLGFYIGLFCCIFGFAMTWHITWLSFVGFFGVIGCLVAHVMRKDTAYYITVAEIEKIESEKGKGYA